MKSVLWTNLAFAKEPVNETVKRRGKVPTVTTRSPLCYALNEESASMNVAGTRYEHIGLDERNVAIIEGTTRMVVELVAEKLAYGWSPEELHFQHPYLTLGQIYSALAYYADHKEALDREMAARLAHVKGIQRAHAPSPLAARLRGGNVP